MTALAWGRKVSAGFRNRVTEIAAQFGGATATDLMACMAFETGRTFSPSIRSMAGSGAVGLIQFMPQTAAMLHTTTEALAAMTAEHQLDYVAAYFAPWKGRLHNLGDLYCAILWPAGVGKDDDAVLFSRDARPHVYLQNRGLDIDHDGAITRREVTQRVLDQRTAGLKPENAC